MRYFYLFGLVILMIQCKPKGKTEIHDFTSVEIHPILQDSLLGIRAIEIMPGSLAFAANRNTYGIYNFDDQSLLTNQIQYDSLSIQFRAVAHTSTDFFMLSIAQPALLYKTGNNGQMELVYKEDEEGVFYDSMKFWNDKEGIAIGDSMNGCFSIIITRDGGNSWYKIPCEDLPKAEIGEGAFAASNTNLEIIGNKSWIATTHGRIYFSDDKGSNWEVINTEFVSDKETEGIYSMDFYNENIGFIIGGDYTNPDMNLANKAITFDGGANWNLVANGLDPGYKSCAQFVPNSGGKEIVVTGFTGISYSKDQGNTWKELSEDSFYTIRFLNDSIAFAAGRGRISKLVFK